MGRDPPTLGLLCYAWEFGLDQEVMGSCYKVLSKAVAGSGLRGALEQPVWRLSRQTQEVLQCSCN